MSGEGIQTHVENLQVGAVVQSWGDASAQGISGEGNRAEGREAGAEVVQREDSRQPLVREVDFGDAPGGVAEDAGEIADGSTE